MPHDPSHPKGKEHHHHRDMPSEQGGEQKVRSESTTVELVFALR